MAYHPIPHGTERVTENGAFYDAIKVGTDFGHFKFNPAKWPVIKFRTRICGAYSPKDHFRKIKVEDLNLVLHCKSMRRLKKVITDWFLACGIGERGQYEFALGYVRNEDWQKICAAMEARLSHAFFDMTCECGEIGYMDLDECNEIEDLYYDETRDMREYAYNLMVRRYGVPTGNPIAYSFHKNCH